MSAWSIQRALNISEAAIMGAKPFPSPYRTGHDICQASRIATLLQQETTRNRWARRVFTRLEWPALVRRFQHAARADGEDEQQYQAPGERSAHQKVGIWLLPKLSRFTMLSNDPDQCRAAIADRKSPLGSLVRHLAGRWAAKEALIKAHRHRQLYMQDISILRARSGLSTAVGQGKPFALIEPVCDTIEMDEGVAALRGLRGFGCRSQGLHDGALTSKSKSNNGMQEGERFESEERMFFQRRAKVNASDRQTAEISISHDGGLSSAVCMVFDPSGLQAEGERIVDDGKGPPMHEPRWGDEGWFETEDQGCGESLDGNIRLISHDTHAKSWAPRIPGNRQDPELKGL